MAKQSHKLHKKLVWKKPVIIVGAATAVALIASQIFFDIYLYRNALPPGDQSVITNLIISAVEGLHKPAAIDPVSGKLYLTDARLVLPLPTDSFMQIVYSSDDPSADQSEVQVTTRATLDQAESKLWSAYSASSRRGSDLAAVFEQVPNLQACARGVQLFYQPSGQVGETFRLQVTKQLANGKTLYMYTEPVCHQDLTNLVEYLKQVESY
jgi:hypothetical protein